MVARASAFVRIVGVDHQQSCQGPAVGDVYVPHLQSTLRTAGAVLAAPLLVAVILVESSLAQRSAAPGTRAPAPALGVVDSREALKILPLNSLNIGIGIPS